MHTLVNPNHYSDKRQRARRRGPAAPPRWYNTNTNSLIETYYIKLQFSPARPTSPLASMLSYKSNLYAPDRKVESHSCQPNG